MGLLHQLHGLGELAAEHRLHGDGAGELAAHGGALPERGHGGKCIRFLAVPAAVLQPAQPLGGVFPVAGHIVVDAQAVGRRDVEWPPHEQLCRGERGLIVRDVFVPDGLVGHGDQPLPGLDVPLAPVAQAPQLHIGDKAVGAKVLAQGGKHPAVGGPERGIVVIRGVALAVIGAVPAAIAGLGVEPVRDVHVALLPRHIADEADHQMDAPVPQVTEAVLGVQSIPGVNALLGLHLPPAQLHIPQEGILGIGAVGHGGIADLRVGERAFVRRVNPGLWRGVFQHGASHSQQEEPCGQQAGPFNHGTPRCTG